MTFLDLIVAGLASWRLALFLSQERGPFDLAGRVRRLFDAERLDVTENEQSRLFACVLCLSFWTSIPALVLFDFWPVKLLAVWGVATALDMALRESKT